MRRDPVRQPIQVAEPRRPPLLVQFVVVAVEPEQRSEDRRVEELEDRIHLVDAVLERRAGQHECVRAPQHLDRARGLGVPVLDALRLVEHDDVGTELLFDRPKVHSDLFVVAEREEGRTSVHLAPRIRPAEDDLELEVGEQPDLLRPLALERGRRHDEHARGPAEIPNDRASRDRLHGLSQAHVVGQHDPLSESEMQRALELVRVELALEHPEPAPARPQVGLVAGAPLPAALRPLKRLHPGIQPPGNANPIRILVREDAKALKRPGGPARKRASQIFEARRRLSAGRRRRDAGARRLALVEIHLDASAPRAGRRDLRSVVRSAERMQRPFHMLARTEAIGAKIGALAGVNALLQRADLDQVRPAARRLHLVIAVETEIADGRNARDFRPAAPSAPLDFLLVRRDPSRELRGRRFFGLALRRPRSLPRHARHRASRVRRQGDGPVSPSPRPGSGLGR